MATPLQIFTHGWMGNSVSIFTFGYHPRESDIADGLICTSWSMYVPGAVITFGVPGASITMEVC